MTDFKAKMHQIRFRLGLRSGSRWGSLQRSPRPPSWIRGPLRGRGRRGRGGRRRGREGRDAPKLLLNQGPSEPCYATAFYSSSFTTPTGFLSSWRRVISRKVLAKSKSG